MNTGWWKGKWWTTSIKITHIHFKDPVFSGPVLTSTDSLIKISAPDAMKSGPRTAMKSGPHLPQLEKALARTEDPAQPKINK